ncbi:MAG: hypothetical protein NTY53_09215 [Kiritimatiellaeota bacterium]|nr:hypothetical protein [Kiritimatiellota bacterium]
MKWIKTIVLWIVTGAVLCGLWMFGVSDFVRPVSLGGEMPPFHRPFARLGFSWLMMAIVFVTAIFLTKKTLDE